MDKPAEMMRAYYIEYPDRDMAIMVEHRPNNDVEIRTGSVENRNYWLKMLGERSVEVFAYTSEWHEVEGVERKLLHWRKLEAEAAVS